MFFIKVLATVCGQLDRMEDPEAKAAMIYILGEFDKIKILYDFAENFIPIIHFASFLW